VTASASTLTAVALLAGARAAGLFLAAPFFSSRVIPWRFKLGLAGVLALALVLSPGVQSALFARADELLPRLARPVDGWLLIASEVFLGAVLGWTGLLVLGAVVAAAHLIAQQAGFSAAAIADPHGEASEAALAVFFEALAVVLFLALGLHHSLIRAVVASYSVAPPGTLSASTISAVFADLALAAGRDLVMSAFVLALPLGVALGLVSLVQGILGRILPEAELFTLGLPIRAAVALAVLAVGLPAAAEHLRLLLEGAVADGIRFVSASTG
jgi:flagellar biosynthetic protein FliR